MFCASFFLMGSSRFVVVVGRRRLVLRRCGWGIEVLRRCVWGIEVLRRCGRRIETDIPTSRISSRRLLKSREFSQLVGISFKSDDPNQVARLKEMSISLALNRLLE